MDDGLKERLASLGRTGPLYERETARLFLAHINKLEAKLAEAQARLDAVREEDAKVADEAEAIIRSLMRELGFSDHILARESGYVSTERVLADLTAIRERSGHD